MLISTLEKTESDAQIQNVATPWHRQLQVDCRSVQGTCVVQARLQTGDFPQLRGGHQYGSRIEWILQTDILCLSELSELPRIPDEIHRERSEYSF